MPFEVMHLNSDGVITAAEHEQVRADRQKVRSDTNRLLKNQDGLVSAVPAVNATLTTPPNWIWISYEGTPNVDMSSIRLFKADKDKTEIELVGLHTMGSDDLMIGINEPLSRGKYQVQWNATY